MTKIRDVLFEVYEDDILDELIFILNKNNIDINSLNEEQLCEISSSTRMGLYRAAGSVSGAVVGGALDTLVGWPVGTLAGTYADGALGAAGGIMKGAVDSTSIKLKNALFKKVFKLKFRDKDGKMQYRVIKAPDLKTAIKQVADDNGVNTRDVEENN